MFVVLVVLVVLVVVVVVVVFIRLGKDGVDHPFLLVESQCSS